MKNSIGTIAIFSIVYAVISHTVSADTLGVVLNDVIKDVSVVQKTSVACSSNPYRITAAGVHLESISL